MKISEFIAKIVKTIEEGIEQADTAGEADAKRFYLNDTDGSGNVGISFEIPVCIVEGEPAVFEFDGDLSGAIAESVPRVAFTVRKK